MPKQERLGYSLSERQKEGAQINSLGASEVLWSMLRHSDGSVIASASSATYGVLMRFQDGEHDTSFGGDGFADDYHSQFTKIMEDPEGRIVALGLVAKSVFVEDHEEMAVRCLLPNGQPDTSLDSDGLFVYPGQGRVAALVPDGDGVLVGGFLFNAQTGSDVVVLRIVP